MFKVMLILVSVYNSKELWSANRTSIFKNSELKVFQDFYVRYLTVDQTIY